MTIQETTISNLACTVSVNDGINVPLMQSDAVCVYIADFNGKDIVTAPDGINFAGFGVTLSLPENWVITDMCDIAALRNKMAREDAERKELRFASRGN